MVSRSSPEYLSRMAALTGGSLLVICALLASLPDAGNGAPFLVFVVLAVAASAVSLSRGLSQRGFKVSSSTCASCAVVFPLLVFDRQENVLMVLAALSVLGLGMLQVIRGRGNEVVRELSATTLVILYVGFLSSYAILVRQADRGRQLIVIVLIMAVSYRLFSSMGRYFVGARRTAWVGHGAGAIGCLTAASASVGLLGEQLPRMWMLGALVGLASIVGDIAGGSIRESVGLPNRGLVGRLDVALFAFPATFYWFRLFLT